MKQQDQHQQPNNILRRTSPAIAIRHPRKLMLKYSTLSRLCLLAIELAKQSRMSSLALISSVLDLQQLPRLLRLTSHFLLSSRQLFKTSSRQLIHKQKKLYRLPTIASLVTSYAYTTTLSRRLLKRCYRHRVRYISALTAR